MTRFTSTSGTPRRALDARPPRRAGLAAAAFVAATALFGMPAGASADPTEGAPADSTGATVIGAETATLAAVALGTGTVAGAVTETSCGTFLHGAELHLVLPADESVRSATAGADGTFSFADIAAGEYLLLATREGYDSVWVETSVVDGGVTTVAVSLAASAGTTTTACAPSPTPTPVSTAVATTAPRPPKPGASGTGTGGSGGSVGPSSRVSTSVSNSTPSTPSTRSPVTTIAGGQLPTLALELPPVPEVFGQTTASMLAQFRAQTGLAQPPTLKELFAIDDISTVSIDSFTGWIPWADPDTIVEVWGYSWPLYLGTFPVTSERAGIIGLDLEALGPGPHHIVIRGMESGKFQIASFDVSGINVVDTPTATDLETLALADGPTVDPWARIAWIFGIAGLAIISVLVTASILARRYRQDPEHRA